jgi:hypothetical protein
VSIKLKATHDTPFQGKLERLDMIAQQLLIQADGCEITFRFSFLKPNMFFDSQYNASSTMQGKSAYSQHLLYFQ